MKGNILFWVIITGIGCILFLFIYENLSSTGSISSQHSNRTKNKINYVTEYNLNGDILECTVVNNSSSPFVWRKFGIDTIGLIKLRMYQGKIGIWKPDSNNSNLICTDISILNKIYKEFNLDADKINQKLSDLIIVNQKVVEKNKNTNISKSKSNTSVNTGKPVQKATQQPPKPSIGTTTQKADEL